MGREWPRVAGPDRDGGPRLDEVLAVGALFDDHAACELRASFANAAPAGCKLGEVHLADLGWPFRRREVRSAMERVLRGALSRYDLDELADRTLGQLFPGARAGDTLLTPLGEGDCSPRLLAALQRAGWATWGELAKRRLPEVADLPHLGPALLAELLGVLFERSAGELWATWARSDGDLALLLRYERGSAEPRALLALLEAGARAGDEAVRLAARRLLQEFAPWALDLDERLAFLLDAAGDARAQRLFRGWELGEDGLQRAELAARDDLTVPHAAAIVQGAATRVRQSLAGAPAWVRWAVGAARDGLGGVTTLTEADAVARRLGTTGPTSTALLLWLAGPYRPVGGTAGWAALDPKRAVAITREALHADGGVRPLPDVAGEIEELSLARGLLGEWLGACGATVVHGLSVVVAGPLPDAVERLLEAHGSAQSSEEICAGLVPGRGDVGEEELARALRSKRFARDERGRVALRSWGGPPQSQSQSQSQPDRLEPRPDLRQPAELVWLEPVVDDALLSGDESPLDSAAAERLGLARGTRRVFACRFGPVTLANDGGSPTRGSVRAVALAAGARRGDVLALGFSSRGELVVEVKAPADGAQA